MRVSMVLSRTSEPTTDSLLYLYIGVTSPEHLKVRSDTRLLCFRVRPNGQYLRPDCDFV